MSVDILSTRHTNIQSYGARTNQQMPLYYQFYENFEQNKERLCIQTAVRKLKMPQLIIHGTADTTVPSLEAENMHTWNPTSELFLLKGANHTFESKHPWEETLLPSLLQSVVHKSIVFVNN